MASSISRRNTRTGIVLAGVVVGMVGLAFASVPLYRLFCQVTGYGGTTQTAEQAPTETIDRTITIRFNADVDPKLPWMFQPNQRQVSVRVGESKLAIYTARNLSDAPVNGTAVFNVTPLKAGLYFNKVQCFCFDEQRLEAGEEVEMAVSFFIDPAIMDDRNLDEVKTITLSYTFFRALGDDEDGSGNAVDASPRTTNQQSAAAANGALDAN
ncbi:MAG: cytochrome c oxidase assembly protein [Alphaproteobacteria bacterium]